MTTTQMEGDSRMSCDHDGRAICWLCSDARPFWREARISAGLSADPPNAPFELPVGPDDCKVDGCNARRYAWDMCKTHYHRWWRKGTTDARPYHRNRILENVAASR